MDPLAAIRDTFFQECEEQLAELESGLLAIEEGDHDPERINAVFRAVHSIKGGAGAFGLEPLVRFAHVFETALDEMRSGGLAPEEHVLKDMLRAADLLADHVAAARGGPAVDEDRSTLVAAELAALTGAEPDGDDEDGDFEIAFQPLGFGGPEMGLPELPLADFGALPDLDGPSLELPDLGGPLADFGDLEDADSPKTWVIALKAHRTLYGHGNETALLLRELRRLGETRVSMDAAALPALDAMDPGEGYLSWTIELKTTEDEDAIREVFEFVDGHCELSLSRTGEPAAQTAPALQAPISAPAPAPASAEEGDIDVAALIRQAQAAVKVLLNDPEQPAEALSPAADEQRRLA